MRNEIKYYICNELQPLTFSNETTFTQNRLKIERSEAHDLNGFLIYYYYGYIRRISKSLKND
jgi:hypothetical protein